MGQMATEQTIAIIEAAKDTTSEPNYWWLMLIAVLPVILAPFIAIWLNKRKK